MNKKVLSLVLSLVMVLGTFTTVFAAEKTDDKKVEKIVGKDNKIQYIIDKKFVEGYGNGDYGYDKNIKRSEITKLLVYANGNKELAEKLQGAMKLYSDVETSFWANGVITVGSTVPSEANGQAMLNGYPDKSFKPANNVSYAELSKMLVVLVKADLTADMVKDANAHWASQWLTWAAQLGILDDVTVANSNAPATRADAFTMVYNALYKMKEFKREASNAKLGILSDLNNSKLVLNQDSEKEYKVTDNTVFVRNDFTKKGNDNYVTVKALRNPEYYLGSLVRILVNDKNEVTHILELGNPKDLALDDSRWSGVSDDVIETKLAEVATLNKDGDDPIFTSHVEIGFNDSKTSVKKVHFINSEMNNNGKTIDKTLKVNDDTKVFVANPANNIMKEVKDVKAALALIGYSSNKWNNIPNVYAGFDNDSYKSAIKGYDDAQDTAKVLVFNVVTDDDWDGDRYRILADTDTMGKALVEDTDGKTYNKDFFKNESAFPFEYGDKYDVIKIGRDRQVNGDYIKKLIDHSKTEDYPIVEVVRTYNDNKSLEIKDEYNNRAVLNVRDADIFNSKEYKNVSVGDKLQFAMDGSDVDVVSFLPKDMKIEGSIVNVKGLKSIFGETLVGRVFSVDSENSYHPTAAVYVFNNTFNSEDGETYRVFNISSKDAKMLNDNLGKEFTFKVSDNMNGWAKDSFAFDFRLNDGSDSNKYPVAPADKTAVDKAVAMAKEGELDNKAKTEAQDEINKIYDKSENEKQQKALDKATIDNARKLIDNYKLEGRTESYYTDLKSKFDMAVKLVDDVTEKTKLQNDMDEAVAAHTKAVNDAKEAEDLKAEKARTESLVKQVKEAKAGARNAEDDTNLSSGQHYYTDAQKAVIDGEVENAQDEAKKSDVTSTGLKAKNDALKSALDTFKNQIESQKKA